MLRLGLPRGLRQFRRGLRLGVLAASVAGGIAIGLTVASAQSGGAPALLGGTFESAGGTSDSADYGMHSAAGQSALGDVSGGSLSVSAGSVTQLDACPTVPGVRERQGCDLAVRPLVRLHVVDNAKSGECARLTGVAAPSCDVPLSGAKVKVFDRNRLEGLVIETRAPGSKSVTLTKNPGASLYDDIFESPVADSGARAATLGCLTDDGACFAGIPSIGDLLVVVRWAPSAEHPDIYTGLPLGRRDFADTDDDRVDDLASKDLWFVETVRRDGTIEYAGG